MSEYASPWTLDLEITPEEETSSYVPGLFTEVLNFMEVGYDKSVINYRELIENTCIF